MNMKNLSFRLVGPGALSVSFSIDSRQGKANGAADALSRFPQKSLDEEESPESQPVRFDPIAPTSSPH